MVCFVRFACRLLQPYLDYARTLYAEVEVKSLCFLQRWTMSYWGRDSIEEVVAHALVGGGGKRQGSRETWRKRLSKLISISVATLCALGCMVYLRGDSISTSYVLWLD